MSNVMEMSINFVVKLAGKHRFRLATALNRNICALLANSTPNRLLKVLYVHHWSYAYFLKAPTVVDREAATKTVKISTM